MVADLCRLRAMSQALVEVIVVETIHAVDQCVHGLYSGYGSCDNDANLVERIQSRGVFDGSLWGRFILSVS